MRLNKTATIRKKREFKRILDKFPKITKRELMSMFHLGRTSVENWRKELEEENDQTV